uniref:FAD-binding protein n=1 Tax=Volvariella volvacea TaxID=36659 RepID=M9ZBQ4_9AGAR|nr:FAD-binding protein [Volvariella volvacea]
MGFLNSSTPHLLLPHDPGFNEVKAELDLAYRQHREGILRQIPTEAGAGGVAAAAGEGYEDAETPAESESRRSPKSQALKTLEETLPYGEYLAPYNPAYRRAIFIGNLLYRLRTPAAVIMPRKVKDIVTVVNCARQYDFVLSVKNGGHSYAGYCLNHGGLVIDLSLMDDVKINQDSTEVTIQAGCLWKTVYDTLVGKDRANIIVGGQCPYVGVSGFTLGGGLSPFSRNYGMGIDNVTEMTIVTAGGEIVTVNNHETDPEKQDLFWALCGGGGGNFGVMVEFKSNVHRLNDANGKVCCGQLTWNLPQQEKEFMAMMNEFNLRRCPEALTVDAIWRYNKDQLLGQMTVLFNGGIDACNEAIQFLRDHNPIGDDVAPMQWEDWVRIEEGFDTKSKVYHHHASFIFGDKAITPELTTKIIRLLNESHELLGSDGTSHILWDHFGGATSRVKATDTPFPWRAGVYAANIKLLWKTGSEEMKQKALKFIQYSKDTLLPHTLDGTAAYLNYIDSTVENWREAYYSFNYERLQKVKTRWDPTNLFRFPQGIVPKGIENFPRPRETGPASAVEKTLDQWSKFSLSQKVVEGLGDADEDKVLAATEVERQKVLAREGDL